MVTTDEANKTLCKLCDADFTKIINKSYHVEGMSLIKLRDILTIAGQIHKENLEEGYYLASIPGGFFKRNFAFFLAYYMDNEILIACYAQEGIIKQHTARDAFDEFERQIKNFIR